MQEQRERSSSAIISTSAVKLLHDYTGRSPTRVETNIDENLVADIAGVGHVEAALDRLSHPPVSRRVVFDLRGLAFLDSAGLRTILRADARGRAEAFEVVVIRPSGTANRVFTLTRVGRQLSIVDGSEAA